MRWAIATSLETPPPCLATINYKQADRWAREHMIYDGNRYIERVKRGDIEPRHIGTKLNLSGIFTKSVTKDVITALYDAMRGVGEFPPMPPSEYDLDDVRHQNAATMISARNTSAISEMDRMSAVERHYNFVRQNEADYMYTDTPTCFDNDLHDSPSGIRGCVRLRRNRPVDIFYIYHNSPLITKRSAYIPGIRIRAEPAGSGFTTTNYLIRTSTIRPGLLFAMAQPIRAASTKPRNRGLRDCKTR